MNHFSEETNRGRDIRKLAIRVTELRALGNPEAGKGGVKQSLRYDQRPLAVELIAKEAAKA